jgi:hypothetical protein
MDPELNLDPKMLQNLTPLVAVCVIFAGLLSVMVKAFLTHLDGRDKGVSVIVHDTQIVLLKIQKELTALAENARRQNQILHSLLFRLKRDRQIDDDDQRTTHTNNGSKSKDN